MATLLALVAWARRVLERVAAGAEDPSYVRSNLKAVAAALDPGRNPRLAGVHGRAQEAAS